MCRRFLIMRIEDIGGSLADIRRCGKGVQDLCVQLDVFDEQRESDEAQIQQAPYGVDLSSHLDVFYAILRQVADTPQEIPFLSILQHLLRIDPKEAVSDIVWDTAETLVHRATLLESREDAVRLLRSPSQGKLSWRGEVSGSRKQSLNTATLPPPAPPPPPPPGAPPPPPPPPALAAAPPPPPPMGAAPPLPPPLLPPSSQPPPHSSPEPLEPQAAKLLPQQETPVPKAKMKTINWNKIPNNKVVGKHNIWSVVARSHQHSPMADLDWSEMEGLFCQQIPPAPTPSASPRPTRDSLDTSSKRKESSEIALLDGKRSLNVNIFLKQFRSSNEDIIQLIRDGSHDDIGAEKLRGLLKILPELDELEMLRAFDGDKSKLGNAEKFLLQLIEVPNYKLRIESMLLKEEFAANMSYLEPSITAMIVAGEDLMSNKAIQEVLYMVVVAGNFLNSGGYAGNAAGVKLSSLQKLTDIRANKPGMNLIHYVALQAEKKRKDLLKLPDDMGILEEATKTTVEQLQNEINALDSRIKKVHKQIDLATTEKEIKDQMADFLKEAEQDVKTLQQDMEELETVRKSLADFFCEDPATFKLEECFKVFHGFCIKFKQAVIENERRRMQEEQAAARRKQREEQLAAKRRTLGHQSSNGSEPECNIVDSLLNDIRAGFMQKKSSDKDSKGKKFGNGMMTSEEDISNAVSSPALSRRRLGSFSCDQAPGSVRDDTYSPDVTPTGSLRRRRSRVPLEEDESTLMDFLRSSGHDGTRERKSWGSLDRSWARRAHGGGRKRPDLLAADFSGERERPSSPSPLAENKPVLPSTPDEENKPKPWKQKIEAWLQENEKEEKQNDDLRRRARRLQNNRRSLEDSESERSGTLDPLPEGKLAERTAQYKRVYPDWKPTIDKTDVVGAMEAIAGAQSPQSPVKDKSPWRKSNLNVPNSTEEIDLDARRQRRLKSRTNAEGSPTILHSISEDEKRKIDTSAINSSLPGDEISEEEKKRNMIRNLGQTMSVEESLPVYIRCPGESSVEPLNKYKAGKVSPLLARRVLPEVGDKQEEINLPPFAPRRSKKGQEGVTDKVEIDSDNIETPPATRRVIHQAREVEAPPRCSRLKSEDSKEEEDTLGDGQFDRFSSARRTRRYRKIPEEEPPKKPEVPELVPEKKIVKSEAQQAQSYPVGIQAPQDTESRLKKWQDRLKYRGEPQGVQEEAIANIAESGRELQKLGHSATLPRSFRNNSSVDHKDVLEAIGKQLKETAEVEVKPKKEEEVKNSSSTLPRSYRRRTGIDHSDITTAVRKYGVSEKKSAEGKKEIETRTQGKTRTEHEMNDEGFEETQSLVSESPSQGTSSGCNYDSVDSPKLKNDPKPKLTRTDSGETNSNLKRSTSMKVKPQEKKSIIPRRSASMRKTDSQSSLSKTTETTTPPRRVLANKQNIAKPPEGKKPELKRNDSEKKPLQKTRVSPTAKPLHCGLPSDAKKKVERSSSRSSLRSSRSSLNSSTSVSTVRNLKPNTGLRTYTRAIKTLTSELERDKKPLGPAQVPASRSSSSGSSIGGTTVRPRPRLNTSFKENTSVPASRSSSSGSSIGPTLNKTGLGFMRPTASSAAKDTIDASRLKSTLRSIK